MAEARHLESLKKCCSHPLLSAIFFAAEPTVFLNDQDQRLDNPNSVCNWFHYTCSITEDLRLRTGRECPATSRSDAWPGKAYTDAGRSEPREAPALSYPKPMPTLAPSEHLVVQEVRLQVCIGQALMRGHHMWLRCLANDMPCSSPPAHDMSKQMASLYC